ncbi:AraC family transcriptional regulator [Paraburkholderia bannensis]|uniref:AraC family transcriptional regulator n=1 Tax=Paraburkholderia bannensis TaxID=765414 RepID=UPI002AAFFE5C|nr:AraC family transcriptional regulator [Paraburkholderia bannensis]
MRIAHRANHASISSGVTNSLIARAIQPSRDRMDETFTSTLFGAAPVKPRLESADASLRRVSRALERIKSHYTEPLKVAELAALVGMSPSAFHAHFKLATSLSPLNYLKTLRLEKSRDLMLTTLPRVHDAARAVGYVSASQFSREYSRLFGAPPLRDIRRLRAAMSERHSE